MPGSTRLPPSTSVTGLVEDRGGAAPSIRPTESDQASNVGDPAGVGSTRV
jgi:hypothetical protein